MWKQIFRAVAGSAFLGFIAVIFCYTHDMAIEGNEWLLGLVSFAIILLAVGAAWMFASMVNNDMVDKW